jgi:glycosyltransferase involved in cell wall biosynthesis
MQKVNILYIITKLELGGAQKHLLSLIGNLDQEKFKVFLFTARKGELYPEAESIIYLDIKKSRFLERPINPFKDLLALIEIYLFIKRNGIEIIHTHSSKAGIIGRLAARLAKVKIILHTVHGWSFNDYQPKLKRKFYVWLEKLSADFTDRIIVVSNHEKKKGLENYIADNDKYHLIRYGIDYTEFGIKDESIRKELGVETNDLLVGMVSCFKPQKSPQDFIKLASLVSHSIHNAKFLLVGDGVLRPSIEKLIRSLNLEHLFILTGWRRDIPRLLSAMDVFVLTSLWEGLPIAVLEAMAASLPVVVADTGGISEIISDGETGFLVSPRDLKNFSERLILLLGNKDLRIRMGQKAKESLDSNFKTKNMVANTQDIYKNLIQFKLA